MPVVEWRELLLLKGLLTREPRRDSRGGILLGSLRWDDEKSEVSICAGLDTAGGLPEDDLVSTSSADVDEDEP